MEAPRQRSQADQLLDLTDVGRSCGFQEFRVLITRAAWDCIALPHNSGLRSQRMVLQSLAADFKRHLHSSVIEFNVAEAESLLKSVLLKVPRYRQPQIRIMLLNQKV